MPISVTEQYLNLYGKDELHFEHTYKHLFEKALHQANYKAIWPVSKGSEVIHSDIIKNLENADLVLCDISTLNPNVFFELGIRTALNKPVCLVKDTFTSKIPFDTHLINCHTYNASLDIWDLEEEIKKLVEHVNATPVGKNALWDIFGFTNTGGMKQLDSVNDQLKYKDLLIEKLKLQIQSMEISKTEVSIKNYMTHKCSNCGFRMEVPGGVLPSYISSAIRPNYVSMFNTSAEQTRGLKCPKCGHIDEVNI